jgi:hypothetical protein
MGARNAFVLHLVAADGQGCHGALNGGLAQAPGRRDTLSKPDDAGKCINHAKAVARWTCDQQPAVICA